MVSKPSLASFGRDVNNHRGNKTLRVAAKDAGVSPATLMRVESGRVPDVATFGKLCKWMGKDPNTYLGFEGGGTGGRIQTISAHLKMNQTPQEETVKAIARMLYHATERQRPSDTADGT
jgi:transcriptional regulator with XRE-family HTH domain